MSRKFYLENQGGERLDLNGVNGVWFYDVTGLGIEAGDEFADISGGFFTLTKKGTPQQSVDGTLLFKGAERLTNYAEAAAFLMQATELRLVFCPKETEYYRLVSLKFLSRGESTRVQLETALSLNVLSPWYLPTPLPLIFDSPISADRFRWNVSGWGTAALAATTAGTYSARVTAGGHLPASVKITFTGNIENPAFKLRGLRDDKIYGQCALSGNYSGIIELNTSYSDSYIRVNGNDLLDDIDLSYEPFFRVPVNEECSLEIDSPEFSGDCVAELYEYYRSV